MLMSYIHPFHLIEFGYMGDVYATKDSEYQSTIMCYDVPYKINKIIINQYSFIVLWVLLGFVCLLLFFFGGVFGGFLVCVFVLFFVGFFIFLCGGLGSYFPVHPITCLKKLM